MASYTLKVMTRSETGSNPDGLKVSVQYLMSPGTASARASAYADIMGGVRLIRGRLIYQRPARDVVFPWCYAKSFASQVLDEDSMAADGVSFNSGALTITVSYEPATSDSEDEETSDAPDSEEPEDAPDTELLKREWDFNTRSLTLPNRFMKWGTTVGAGSVDALIGNDGIAAVKMVPQVDYLITRHFVRNKPATAITQLLGTVNKDAFRLYGEVYKPETLRFDSAKDSQVTTTQGVKCFEMVYKFAIQPVYDYVVEATNPVPDGTGKGYVGWNRVFNPRVCKWERIVWTTNPARGIYLLDKDQPSQTIRGNVSSGFLLLFKSGAK